MIESPARAGSVENEDLRALRPLRARPNPVVPRTMARRFHAPYLSEPVSSLAGWARNLAVFAVIAVVVSIIVVRFDFLEMKPALMTFFGALGLAVLSILVGLAAFAAIWHNGSRGMSRVLLALDLDARGGRKLESVPAAITNEVLAKLAPLFD